MDIHPNKTALTWVINQEILAVEVNIRVKMDHSIPNHLLQPLHNQVSPLPSFLTRMLLEAQPTKLPRPMHLYNRMETCLVEAVAPQV
jgi:hypothetical protein